MIQPVLLKRIFLFIVTIGIAVFVYIHFSAFWPILLALLTAMIFEPFVKWLQRKMKVDKRLLPVTIVFLSFLVICGLSLYFTLTKVIKILYDWTLQIPQYAMEIEQFINTQILHANQLLAEIPQGNIIIKELESQSQSMIETALRLTTEIVTGIGLWLQSIPNTLFVALVYLITLFLFSLDLPRLLHLFFNFFKAETSGKLQIVFQRMSKVFLGYWKAQFILSVGVFIITYISLLFISPQAALIMSVIIWVVDIIPLYVGPALILVPWGVIAMIIGSKDMGIQLIVLAIVLLIVRRIIEPKVLGDSIGLAALPTVLSMYFGYVFFGVLGLIFGPFVYIAIRSAKESGLFETKIFKEKDLKVEGNK